MSLTATNPGGGNIIASSQATGGNARNSRTVSTAKGGDASNSTSATSAFRNVTVPADGVAVGRDGVNNALTLSQAMRFNSASFVVALPTAADATAAIVGHPNNENNFAFGTAGQHSPGVVHDGCCYKRLRSYDRHLD